MNKTKYVVTDSGIKKVTEIDTLDLEAPTFDSFEDAALFAIQALSERIKELESGLE